MRFLAVFLGVALVSASGCAGPRARRPAVNSNAPDPAFSELPSATPVNPALPPLSPPKLTITPDNSVAGKVVSFDAVGRFVVVTFPLGHMPGPNQLLQVYRLGLKVGEVKTSSFQNDDSIVADILAGEAAVGDEIRGK